MFGIVFATVVIDWDQIVTGLISSVVFSLVGIAVLILGFKLFDLATPRIDFSKELTGNGTNDGRRNYAVAAVIAGFLLGLAYIVGNVVHP